MNIPDYEQMGENPPVASDKRLPPSPVIVERNLAPPLARHVVFVQNWEEEVVVAGCERGTSLQGVYWKAVMVRMCTPLDIRKCSLGIAADIVSS